MKKRNKSQERHEYQRITREYYAAPGQKWLRVKWVRNATTK
jgi:hypothetical protein